MFSSKSNIVLNNLYCFVIIHVYIDLSVTFTMHNIFQNCDISVSQSFKSKLKHVKFHSSSNASSFIFRWYSNKFSKSTISCDIVCSCLSKSINNESTDSLNFFDWNRSNNQIFFKYFKAYRFQLMIYITFIYNIH